MNEYPEEAMYSWVLEHYLALSFLCIGWNSVHELQPFSIYLDHMQCRPVFGYLLVFY